MYPNIPNLNMEYHMLYVERRKNFKVRGGKKLFNLPSAKIKHSANEPICRVPDKNTRQDYLCRVSLTDTR